MSVNSALFIGNLGNDPKWADTQGAKLVTFSLAVKRVGSKTQDTDWFEIRCYNEKKQQVIMDYLKKGHKVSVAGSVHINTCERDGRKGSKTYVLLKDFQMLTKKESGASSSEYYGH